MQGHRTSKKDVRPTAALRQTWEQQQEKEKKDKHNLMT